MENFFDAEVENLGGQAVFRGNLDIKDSKKLANNLCPFSERDSGDIVWIKLSRLDINGRIFPHTKLVV